MLPIGSLDAATVIILRNARILVYFATDVLGILALIAKSILICPKIAKITILSLARNLPIHHMCATDVTRKYRATNPKDTIVPNRLKKPMKKH